MTPSRVVPHVPLVLLPVLLSADDLCPVVVVVLLWLVGVLLGQQALFVHLEQAVEPGLLVLPVGR